MAEFPWDPKLDAALGSAAAPQGNAGFAQQQMSPQEGALPYPPVSGPNGQQPADFIKPDPDIKQEPGVANPHVAPPAYTHPDVAAARATQALQKEYGQRANNSINAIQAGMSAQNPAQAAAMRQQPLNGHPNPEQVYHQQVSQQVSHQAPPQVTQQAPHPSPAHPQQQQQQQPQQPPTQYQPLPQVDGFDAEGVLMERDASGNMVEMGRLDIDRMLHSRILENAKSMEGGGFMVPLKEATKHTASRKNKRTQAAPGQVDGEDDEDDEDAINSDLDDTDDDREDSEVDEEGLSHIMLCMYDKVQRVKNKWYGKNKWRLPLPL